MLTLLAPQNVPSILGGAFVKARGLSNFVMGLNWPELPNLVARGFLWPSEFGPDPPGLIGDACISPPRSKLRATS